MTKSAQKRRIGGQHSETRALIVETTERVIRDEGYAAASTRRVALHAGLNPSLVHYYFPTTDDLLLAVFRRGAEQSDKMMAAALAGENPMRELWRFFCDTSRTALALEFLALASHRKEIREEIAKHSREMRERQVELLSRLAGDRLNALNCPPAGLSVLLAGIGRALVMEGGLGVDTGHDEARRFVEQWLNRLQPRKADD